MVYDLSEDDLKEMRRTILAGVDSELYRHLGYFLSWFGSAEAALTTILAIVLDLTEFERVEFLVRGMDPRVKCEILRQAAERYRPIGDNLKPRLSHFERTIIPLRNKISHSRPVLEPGTDTIHFNSLGRISEPLLKGLPPDHGLGKIADRIHLDDLLRHGAWVQLFSTDLVELLMPLADGKPLDIVDPKSSLPKQFQNHQQPKEKRAKPDKRARTPRQTRD